MKKILNIYLLWLICACTPLGENFKQTDITSNESLIYIYYPYNSCGTPQKVYLDDKFLTTLYCGGYKLVRTPAGRKKITSATDSIISLDTQAGKTYFIKGKSSRYNPQGCLFCNVLHLTLRTISPDIAINELKECQEINE